MDSNDYRKLLETAPALNVPTLEDKFKMLADYGGAVLAGRETKYGFEFVTWDWDFNRKGVNHGHYYQDTLCDAYELDEKQRKTIESVQEQIRFAIPDIVEQIHEHDRQAYEQEHGQKFEQTM